ncbi:NUDIX domain-containing protein [Fadolivirus algeromassiliense]|jgi:hypothetical protein|uniref:NUDIX domain-containing protein n=1 Tax=Fadolivirus FV1/VV64 TaxID=3070911 RepID=A0A7D3R087_9VIRU|nr:NUDIX domain-containing protein [Fadolivirus algeromassiliense]QKF93481.1 NUDIX domain-containing protein [Fadolivirus FV1/VV64]
MNFQVVDTSVLDITTHITGHVFIITKNKNIILGHNKIFDYIASFGGYKDDNETLLETILREWTEETHESIMDKKTLFTYLKNAKCIMNQTEKGVHYTFFCEIDDIEFDMDMINNKLNKALCIPNLKEDQLENDYITLVSLDDIKFALLKGDYKIKNHLGKYETIRNSNILYYKIYLSLI